MITFIIDLLVLLGAPLLSGVLFVLLGKGPRASEGRILALLVPLLLLMTLAAYNAKREEAGSETRINLNDPRLEATALSDATQVPLDLAQQVIDYRNRLKGGVFRSRNQVPSLGEASPSEIRQLHRWAEAGKATLLQEVVQTGRIPSAESLDNGETDPKSGPGRKAASDPTNGSNRGIGPASRGAVGRGLFPSMDLQVRAAALLPHPPLSLDHSPRSDLMAVLGNEAVVERILQRRTLSNAPLQSLSQISAIPLDAIALRTPALAFGGFIGLMGGLIALLLAGHFYLRRAAPDADTLLWPVFGGLSILGVLMLFAIGEPLTDRGSVWSTLGVLPEYASQGLLVMGAMLLLPFMRSFLEMSERFGQPWLYGVLAMAALVPNVLAEWGWPVAVGGLLLLSGLGIAGWRYAMRRSVPPPSGGSASTGPDDPVLASPDRGTIHGPSAAPPKSPSIVPLAVLLGIVALLTVFRIESGRMGYALLVEAAKVLMILFTARLCTDYELSFGERLSDLPPQLFFFWLLALVFAFLSEDLGFLLLLWIPFTLLLSLAVGRRRPALLGGAGLILGGMLLIASGHTRFPERWRAWLDPWTAPSSQLAELYQRMASVPSIATGSGLGHGMRLAVSTDTRDLILPLYYEQLGWLGTSLVVLLLLIGIHRLFRVALRTESTYAHWVALGFGCVFSVQTLYMIGASVGGWPLTGLTLAPLASGKAAAGLTLFMAFLVLSSSSEPRVKLDHERRERARLVSWGYAGCVLVLLYCGVRLYRTALLDRDETALRAVDGLPNRRVQAELASLRTGRILARKSGLSYDPANLTSLAYSERSPNGEEIRHYPLGPPSFPVTGVRASHQTIGGEAQWRGELTGLDAFLDRSPLPLSTAQLEPRLLLDLWRRRNHPLWPRAEAIAPEDLQTTLDADLQTMAYDALRAHLRNSLFRSGTRVRKGAMLIVDLRTGEALAYAQYPSPNPEAMAQSWEAWDRVARDPNGTLDDNGNPIDLVRHTDRAPGSTAKINTMMALSENGKADLKFWCRPGIVVNGSVIRDHDNVNHGRVGLREILKYSCNRGAAQSAAAIGPDALLAQYRKLRYSLPHMSQPEKTFREEYQQIAFGQSISASLWELARSVCAVARGGEAIELHLVQKKPELVEKWRVCSPETAARVADGMTAVDEPGGTAFSVYRGLHDWPSKTGSAELNGATETDAWFVGYAPRRNPALAFVVWAEEDGTGGGLAQSIHLPDLIERALQSIGVRDEAAAPAVPRPTTIPGLQDGMAQVLNDPEVRDWANRIGSYSALEKVQQIVGTLRRQARTAREGWNVIRRRIKGNEAAPLPPYFGRLGQGP